MFYATFSGRWSTIRPRQNSGTSENPIGGQYSGTLACHKYHVNTKNLDIARKATRARARAGFAAIGPGARNELDLTLIERMAAPGARISRVWKLNVREVTEEPAVFGLA